MEGLSMGVLDGRTAIVTGASRGLGKDIAVALGAAGASVAAVARTTREGESRIPGTLEDTVRLVTEAGAEAIAVRADVTREGEIAEAVRATFDRFGRIDILVNNAGILIPGSVADLQAKHWELAFRVNVHGPFHFCRAVLPHLVDAGGGHIINVSSRAAIGPGPGPYDRVQAGGAPYGATKSALERFSQGLATEVFPEKISVNALSPHLPLWSEGGHFYRENLTIWAGG